MIKIDGESIENFALGLYQTLMHMDPVTFSDSPNHSIIKDWVARLVEFAKELDGQDVSVAKEILSDLSEEASNELLCFEENLRKGQFELAKSNIELVRFVFNLQIGINPQMLDIELANQAVALKKGIRDSGEWFPSIYSDLYYIDVFCVGLYSSGASSSKEINGYYIQTTFNLFLKSLDGVISDFDKFLGEESGYVDLNEFTKKERAASFSKTMDLKKLRVILGEVPEEHMSSYSVQSLDAFHEKIARIKEVLCEVYGAHTARESFSELFVSQDRGNEPDSNRR